MTDASPPGINVPAVSQFLAQNVPGAELPLQFELIGDGRSNLTFRVSSAGRRWVLRRPPLGHILPTAHDMAREFRVISALAGTGVPVPETFALCEDTSVNDYPFYIMEFVEGVIIGDEMPAGYATEPEQRRALGLGIVEALARLHAVDYREVGLGDFGRPDGYLKRQVSRWARQWEQSKTRDLPELEELARRLMNAIPPETRATIVHGDFRLGNIVMDGEKPGNVLALLDWEMATLGDPLADLGYTLVFWGQQGDPPDRFEARMYAEITTADGFSTRAELVQHYAEASGQDVSAIDFYEAFALYKLAVIVEGLWARHLKGKTVGEGFEQYRHSSPILVNSALAFCDASKLRGLHH